MSFLQPTSDLGNIQAGRHRERESSDFLGFLREVNGKLKALKTTPNAKVIEAEWSCISFMKSPRRQQRIGQRKRGRLFPRGRHFFGISVGGLNRTKKKKKRKDSF